MLHIIFEKYTQIILENISEKNILPGQMDTLRVVSEMFEKKLVQLGLRR